MERNSDQEYISRSSRKLGQNNVAENDEANQRFISSHINCWLYSVYVPYSGLVTAPTVQHDKGSAVAVVRNPSDRWLVAV
jgi:hypothetical protein